MRINDQREDPKTHTSRACSRVRATTRGLEAAEAYNTSGSVAAVAQDASSAAQEESNTELASGLCVLEREAESCRVVVVVVDKAGCVSGWIYSRRLFLKLFVQVEVEFMEGEACKLGRFVPDSDGNGAGLALEAGEDAQVASAAAALCCC